MLKTAPKTDVGVADGYKKGLHILSNFQSSHFDLLQRFEPFQKRVNQLIIDLELSKVGEAYHNFDGGGFTAVVCLAESHLSIHTWPDIGYATFDVYLSNHSHDNSDKAKIIYTSVKDFFNASVSYENLISR